MHSTKVGEIGEVMHLAKSGRLIVKLNSTGEAVKAGELLVDASGKRVGRVVELIGPVNAPYASVIPMTDRTNRLVGAKVFYGGAARPSRDGRASAGQGRRSRYRQ